MCQVTGALGWSVGYCVVGTLTAARLHWERVPVSPVMMALLTSLMEWRPPPALPPLPHPPRPALQTRSQRR